MLKFLREVVQVFVEGYRALGDEPRSQLAYAPDGHPQRHRRSDDEQRRAAG